MPMTFTPSPQCRAKDVRTILFLLVCLLGLPWALAGCDDETTNTFTAKIGDKWFTLETAYSLDDRGDGMMHRTEIAEDGGMIFIFRNAQERRFWMKNCLVDMDIIYVDRARRIVSAYNMKMQPPKRDDESMDDYESRIRDSADYPSRGAAQYVIELKAGKIQELGLQRGQKLDLDEDGLKKLVRLADDNP